MEKLTQIFTNCLDPGFGYENRDGYVRILNRTKKLGGTLVMRHRWFWELQNGPIEEGMEINHLCKNRRCCNVEHLELITRPDHAILTNRERYLSIKLYGEALLKSGVDKYRVMELTNRCAETVNRWKRGLENA